MLHSQPAGPQNLSALGGALLGAARRRVLLWLHARARGLSMRMAASSLSERSPCSCRRSSSRSSCRSPPWSSSPLTSWAPRDPHRHAFLHFTVLKNPCSSRRLEEFSFKLLSEYFLEHNSLRRTLRTAAQQPELLEQGPSSAASLLSSTCFGRPPNDPEQSSSWTNSSLYFSNLTAYIDTVL